MSHFPFHCFKGGLARRLAVCFSHMPEVSEFLHRIDIDGTRAFRGTVLQYGGASYISFVPFV